VAGFVLALLSHRPRDANKIDDMLAKSIDDQDVSVCFDDPSVSISATSGSGNLDCLK
jgi:hypothetical protein